MSPIAHVLDIRSYSERLISRVSKLETVDPIAFLDYAYKLIIGYYQYYGVYELDEFSPYRRFDSWILSQNDVVGELYSQMPKVMKFAGHGVLVHHNQAKLAMVFDC